jgi:type IV pilus assembly protein PilZ
MQKDEEEAVAAEDGVVVLPVRFALGPHPVQATTRALTPEAVFIRAEQRPRPGARIALRLYLPSGPPADLAAVVSGRAAPAGESGFWANFSALAAGARARILAVAGVGAAARSSRSPAPPPAVRGALPRLGGLELRTTTRIAASLRVCIGSAAELREEMTLNVSAGGLFIRTDAPPPLREIVVVSIELPDESAPVETRAQVVHIVTREQARASGRPAGVGVQFVEANDRFRARLDEWLAKQGG